VGEFARAVTIETVYALSLECAQAIWDKVEPSDRYAHAVARLLTGTAAHESGGLRWTRQLDRRGKPYSDDDLYGAWSYWQLELGSVETSIALLTRRPGIEGAAMSWYRNGEGPQNPPWRSRVPIDFMVRLKTDVALACLFARLHYLRVPAPVPADVVAQAWYWKKYYNTRAGRGTPHGYLRSWYEHCETPLVALGDTLAKLPEDWK
jgi:hypothetical protein